MVQNFCSYLGSAAKDGARCPAQNYPSFENQCFAVDLIDPLLDELESQDQLLLSDQATYCLGSGHRVCPRYQMLHGYEAAREPAIPPGSGDGEEASLSSDPALLDELAYDYVPEQGPRMGFWVGIASLVLVFMVCGGSLATYAGWQLVGRGLVPLSQRLGQMADTSEREQVFLLVTPTPAALANRSLLPTPAVPLSHRQAAIPTPDFSFPAAVTPTSMVAGEQASGEESGPVVITTPTVPLSQDEAPAQNNPAQDGQPPANPALATAVAGPVVITTPGGLEIPTRRPTPIFEVPTSTPGEPAVVVVTATPTPTYPEPEITFLAAHQSLPSGQCTTLFWEVENVRAVFLDNEGVFGKGERRVCIRSAPQTYTLSVLRMDGVQEDHPVTVELLVYTPTPTATPTSTPVLTPTPTWTPEAGGSVPTAEAPQHGLTLTVDGGNQRQCQAGQLCETIIQVANTGTHADEIFIDLGKEGPWQVQICRPDNICGETNISLGIGVGDRQPIVLRATIPAESQGESYSFQMIGASGNSGRTVRSEPIYVIIAVE